MLYILTPEPILPIYTLAQALDWVAHRNYYSGYTYEDQDFYEAFNSSDVMDDSRLQEKLEEFYPALLGAPYSFDDLIASLPHNADLSSEEIQKKFHIYNQNKQIYDTVYNDVVNEYYSQYKAKLFVALKEEKLAAYGRCHRQLKPEVPSYLWKEENSWEQEKPYEDFYGFKFLDLIETEIEMAGFKLIPSSFWDFEGINWNDSEARSRNGWYNFIFFDVNDLFEIFPEAEEKVVGVTYRNDTLIMEVEDLYDKNEQPIFKPTQKNNKLGRKPYYWQEMHAEILRYCLEYGALPEKKMALEAHLQDFCRKRWGKVPSHGSIHEQIQPYYTKANIEY